ncbi:thioredoxin domain-containing protein [Chloroflexota bacterium]
MNNKEMSKRQIRKEQVRRKEKQARMVSIILVAVGALLVAFFIILPNIRPVGGIATPSTVTRPAVDFNKAGDPNAKIKITEYSDFQCPYCRLFSENTEPLLMAKYVETGIVYFEYKTVGGFIGPESEAAAEAAYCAGDQGKFWEMHDVIFANQTGENVGAFSNPRLESFAKSLELDMTEFKDCTSSGKYSDLAAQDGKDATAAGIQATPSFLLTYEVNGETQVRVLQGAQGIDAFSQEIEAALAELGQ